MGNKNIFFSYGHDCTAKVLRIKEDLERAGYSVWLDTEGIAPGDDWRAKITAAILDCDFVVAFLSKYALRKDGVCLSELAIAVSHKTGFIKTVLLEPDIQQYIPATISGIQYCDMGGWDARSNGKEFESWYQDKFSQLISSIEQNGDESRDLQIKYLEQTLSPTLASHRRNIELQKPFVDRTWMEQEIDLWLKNSDSSQYLLLYGGPGTGKSAFSSHYFHFDDRVVGSAFCEWGCRNYSSPAQILKSIAFQMALKLPTYRVRLANVIEGCGRVLDSYAAQELLDLLFVQPLYGDTAGDQIFLVIIDGADEANENGNNELAELLSACSNRLPPFLKILITSRNDAIVQRYFSDCQELHIDAHTAEIAQDIYRYLKEQLRESLASHPNWRQEQLLNELVEKSGSSFLYAELLVKSVRSDHLSLEKAGTAPQGLHGLYFNWMRRKFPDSLQYESEYLPALSLIAAAHRLPVRMLDKALGIRGPRLKKFLRQLKTFLETEQDALGETCVYFFHRSFAEWLCSEDADIYELSPEDGVQTLAETMYASYQDGTLTDFETEYLLDYLQDSGMSQEYQSAAQDQEFLRRLFALGQSCEAIAGGFQNAAQIYGRIEALLAAAHCQDQRRSPLYVSALCGKGRCLFALGSYDEALTVLASAQEDILTLSTAEERLRSLLILGSVYDWKGDRSRSVETFRLLQRLAQEAGDTGYLLRSYEGLIWNEHFNDMAQATATLSEISQLVLSKEEELICSLCLARILLSQGNLTEALARYDVCYSTFDFSVFHDFYAMKKTKMLLLEILPACFDNERYLDGIRYGLQLWGQLRNQGWLEECYCASWIAMNYLRLGNTDAAEQYLYHAQACNNTISAAAKSSWMQMHLTSVEAFLRFEQARFQEAFAAHLKVLDLARSCQDAWIQGDACFELLALRLLFLPAEPSDPLVSALAQELEEIGAASGLSHLQCKSTVIQALLAAFRGDDTAAHLIQQARETSQGYHLASTDPVELYYIEYRVLALADPATAREAAMRLEAAISQIDALNQTDGQSYQRLFVQRIKNEEVFG